MTWWSKASTAQKLAQIDGGISLGMTARQIALASRATLAVIQHFANDHGRLFGRSQTAKGGVWRRGTVVNNNRQSYLRGDRINLWGNTEAQDEEFALDEVQS